MAIGCRGQQPNSHDTAKSSISQRLEVLIAMRENPYRFHQLDFIVAWFYFLFDWTGHIQSAGDRLPTVPSDKRQLESGSWHVFVNDDTLLDALNGNQNGDQLEIRSVSVCIILADHLARKATLQSHQSNRYTLRKIIYE